MRRNYGCPGNDRLSIKYIRANYQKYENLVLESLINGTYVFEKEPKRILINDYLKKEREIFIYNVTDRWVQQFLKLQIEPLVEVELPEYVYAFRRGKCDIDSYHYILINTPKYILRTDIKNYFNSLDKEKILRKLRGMHVEDGILGSVEKSMEHCKKGIPPGHVLSCIFSNVSLIDFDIKFSKNYTRYSDDMMFSCKTKLETYLTLLKVTMLLKKEKLYLNHAKTRIVTSPTLEKIS